MNGLVLCHTVVLLVDHGCGDGAHEDHNPDNQAKDLGHFGAPQMPPAERVDNGNVAVQVDAHEEEAATIHVDLEDRARDLAQKVIKGPVVVGIVVESQWQRKCEDEVTHGQVEHVDHHHRLQTVQTGPGQQMHLSFFLRICNRQNNRVDVMVEMTVLQCN
uniref:Secreted protein n=1 Tax=Dromaius novaehollandiae TaxID=8790 RepID=A0A8C4KDP6_DRONO